MAMRMLIATVCLISLSFLGSGDALAQKTKSKVDAPATSTEQTRAPTLDPRDPVDLETILDKGDAAYFVEDGGTPDFKAAFEMYSLAADAGDAYAMNRIALMYDRGEFVAQDFTKAFEWYLKSAEAGLPAGQSNVGSMYSVGDGVTQDYAAALNWFRKAADNDYAYAMYAIGDMYLLGNGVNKDSEEAAAWFKKASDGGDPNGHWSLALRYLYGDGVGKDTQRAAELGYKALTQGLQVALDEFKDIGNAETSPNFRRAIQEMLKRDGFYTGSIDGSFGPQTMRAIEAAFGTDI